MGNGSIEQARAMYAELGLCYECGRTFAYCTCPPTKAEIQAATYEATCTACNIADAMKVCDFCVFRQCRSVSDEDEKFIMLVAAASFEFPWTDAEVASEEDNHRPEVSL